ncbi:hypothetical protein CUJ84_Chr003544 [Rhizobium leguminosarum]|uniref:Uncharacterized protein n=1 Tax=Rhizobium leguminosarum TaxID=384 RepID=A0A2K9Z6M5_RHILE|nr:hypothetical protein CUJ84_Chr003544 [Rhizobium leguminosarum]
MGRQMSGIGFRSVRANATGQEPVFRVIYFTKTSSGNDLESPNLEEIVARLALDAQKEYIRQAFNELQELIEKAFVAGLESRQVEILIEFDLFLGYTIYADGLVARRKQVPFDSVSAVGRYVVHQFKLEPIQGASRADVLATTTLDP